MRLNALSLSTRDLARSRAFYTHKLGFRVVEERVGEAFVVDAGGVMLQVDRRVGLAPLTQPALRLVFDTEGLTKRCAALRDLGISVDGPRKGERGAFAELADPDGHPITLWEVRESPAPLLAAEHRVS